MDVIEVEEDVFLGLWRQTLGIKINYPVSFRAYLAG